MADEYSLNGFTKNFSINIVHVPSGKKVSFEAFLISLGDSFKPNFKSTPVYGRMDSIVNYQNTSRTISLSFAVPARSEEHARQNLIKFNNLAKFQYPSYNVQGQASGIASAPICKLIFNNLIQFDGSYLYGYFSSIDFAPVNESGYFFEPTETTIFPKEFKLSLSFTVLHTKPLGWRGGSFSVDSFPYNVGDPFISTDRGNEVVAQLLSAGLGDAGDIEPVDPRAQALIDKLNA